MLMFCLLISAVHGLIQVYHYSAQVWPEENYDRPLQIQGEVIGLPHQKKQALQFFLNTPFGPLQVNWYWPYPDIQPGEIWNLSLKVKKVEFMDNPGEFNYAAYLRREGIVARAYVMNRGVNQFLSSDPWRRPLDSLRYQVYQGLLEQTRGLPMRGILLALILGDKTQVNSFQMEVFERTGTSYFMVISGLHIVLFAFMGAFLGRWLWSLSYRATLWLPATQFSLIVGLALAVLYSLLAGFVVPTQRALWMITVMGFSKLFLKQVSSQQALFFAFLGVLFWNPFAAYSIAFWLSFLAVFFLIYTLKGRRNGTSKRWRRILHEWFYPQWVMYIALSPLLLFYFQTFSFIGLLTNLIALPFMILAVIPLALLAAVLLFILPDLAHGLFYCSNQVMEVLWGILHYFAMHPGASFHLKNPGFIIMLLGQLGVFIILAPRAWPMRYAGLLMLLPLFFPKPNLKPGEVVEVNLKVHEGFVRIYQTQKHVVIEEEVQHVKTAFSDLAYIVRPYLYQQGIETVDLWVLKMEGNEHAFNHLRAAWQPIRIREMRVSDVLPLFNSKRLNCQHPYYFIFDGVSFEGGGESYKGSSCWARLASLSS